MGLQVGTKMVLIARSIRLLRVGLAVSLFALEYLSGGLTAGLRWAVEGRFTVHCGSRFAVVSEDYGRAPYVLDATASSTWAGATVWIFGGNIAEHQVSRRPIGPQLLERSVGCLVRKTGINKNDRDWTFPWAT